MVKFLDRFTKDEGKHIIRIKHLVENPKKESDVLQSGKYAFYNWRIFIDGTPPILERIKKVEYTLHPTYPKPIVTVENRTEKFMLQASGWGEFRIGIKIFLEGQDSPVQTFYPLTLDQSNEPRQAVALPL